MKFTLTINCDNAAFDEAGIATELRRILSCVSQDVGEGATRSGLFDVNGNRVGSFEITED